MSGAALEPPPRPYVPPIFAGAFMCVSVSAVVLWVSWYDLLNKTGNARLCAAGFVFIGATLGCIAFVLRGRSRARWVFWAALGVALSAVSSLVWVQQMTADVESCASTSASAFEFRIDRDPVPTKTGYMVSGLAIGDSAQARMLLTSSDKLERGRMFKLVGRVSDLDNSDWGISRYFAGDVKTVRVVKVLEETPTSAMNPFYRVREKLLSTIDPAASESASIVAGVLCGRTTEVREFGLKDVFSRTGTSHLMAVSGTHLAVVSALLLRLSDAMSFSIRKRSAIMCLGMGAYAILTGFSLSAARSLVMNASACIANVSDRRKHALSNLMIAVLLMVTLDPSVVFDLGFQLSAVSVLTILIFGEYAAYAFERLRIPRALAGSVAVSVVAQLGCAPITVPTFGLVSLVGPLANIIAVPLMSALLVCSICIGVVCVMFPICGGAFALSRAIADLLIFWLRFVSRVPFACLSTEGSALAGAVIALCAAGLYFWWPRVRPRFFAGCIGLVVTAATVHVVRWSYFAPPSVTVLDVGQADAILIREGSRAVLVDAGVDDKIEQALFRNNVYRLDAVFITHWDEDHWGGFPYLVQSVQADKVIVNEGAAASAPRAFRRACACGIEEMSEADSVAVGSYRLQKIWPQGAVAGEENGESLCMLLSRMGEENRFSMLLTGDTEKEQEHEYAEFAGDIDVLKVGHHGSKVSVDDEVLDILKPEVAIASAGAGNSYGHPSAECTEALERAGARFFCTIEAGDVSVEPTDVGYMVGTSGVD